MDVQLYCVIKKGFSWRGKKYFVPYKRLQHSTLSISQGTDVTIVTEYAVRFLNLQVFFLFAVHWALSATVRWGIEELQ